MTEVEKAAHEWWLRNRDLNSLGEGTFTPEAAFLAGAAWQRENMGKMILSGIDREQSYREFRDDQDGSGIGACKEIRGYVKAVIASLSQQTCDDSDGEKS